MPAFNVFRGMASTRTKLPMSASRPSGLARSQRQTTIAEDDCGNTMFVRGGAQRVPPDLSVEMSVKVDNARRHRQTVDIQYAPSLLVDSPDGDDPSVANRQIRNERGHPRTVVNPSVL
jgi:hypothetical protein